MITTGTPGSGNVWLDNVQCVGNENRLTNCAKSAFGDTNCPHSMDVWVSCGKETLFIYVCTLCTVLL